ncbi:phage tail tape measure protein [Gracilibacillus salitolerans]|uniref:Phage tail tape measure protein n=1 Tax=Gracilibacillus salitolerans TaxID=2663022 RepID=A0A5Q2TMP2_9BACI|nr:phage tail tape measure protein [Gracilibacillus salitolerans]QGH35130.1 phage tail tape measure protein [Gracilibacillus salitolerans]
MATRDVGNLRTRLSWEDEGATRSLKGFEKDLKGLRSEMNLARSGGKEYTNSLKGLRQQSDILTRRFRTQEERVKELRKRYDESVQVKGRDAEQTQNLENELRNATAQMNRTENQLERVNTRIEEQINPWKRLGREMDDAGQQMQTIGRGMTDFGKNYSMRVTAPIVAGGAAVFKASMDFESAFAGVEKTVEGTEQQLSTVRQEIRDMAKDIPATTEQIASVAESAGQLGIVTENVTDFTKTMIDLGEATNMTSEQAATEFARFANIVGMSQDDFDKLGSVIVDLGNNLATTESEISSMAMRIAGAGTQVGLTESEILAFSGALSSVGIEAEAGGSAFSKVMVNMQLAAETGGDSLDNFAKVAGVSAKDFKDAYEQDATGAIISFIEGLSTAEDRGLSAIGILDEMGIKEVRLRDTLLRAAGATEVFNDAIEIGSGAWKENTALTEEAEKRYETTESQMRIMWNRIKDVAISLGDALVPAVMDAIDAAEPFIQKIEDGAEAFADMDEEQQRTILKLIGLAAAIGPVSVGLGGMTTTIGGLLRVGGSVSTMLGRAGGAGLIGRIGLLGLGGPVGLAVGGVAALTTGVYLLNEQSKESTEEVLNSIEKRKEELDTLDELVSRYETLKEKNKLSTDEVLRYMDIMTELKDAKTEKAIEALTKEQEGLLEKSGFTNQEMEEFLELNGEIVEQTPSKVQAISEQGNAYVEVTEKVKELNEAERQRLLDDTYVAIKDRLDEHKNNLEDQRELQAEIKELEGERSSTISEISSVTDDLREKDLEIHSLREKIRDATGEEAIKLSEKLLQLEDERDVLDSVREKHDQQIDRIDKQIGKKEESLGKTKEEIEAYNDLLYEYEAIILSQLDLNAERGEGVLKLEEEISKLNEAKKQLEDNKEEGKLTTQEYQEQVKEIDEQVGNLRDAKRELENIVDIADTNVYKDRNRDLAKNKRTIDDIKKSSELVNEVLSKDIDKDVDVDDNGTAEKVHDEATKKGDKTVDVSLARRNNIWDLVPSSISVGVDLIGGALGFAKGTDSHPGGRSWLGEEGPELVRYGSKWAMANFGLYDDVPRGAQVFTHDESKKILRSLNNTPGYAEGISPTGEADRIANRLSQPQQSQGQAVIYTTVINQINGREVSREIYRDITELQERDREIESSFK